MRITVVAAVKYPLILDMLRALLESDRELKYVGGGTSTLTVVDVVRKQQPRVLVMLFPLEEALPLETIARVAEVSPSTRVLLINPAPDALQIRRAVDGGAHGLVTYGVGAAEALDSIKAVAGGHFKIAVPPRTASAVTEGVRSLAGGLSDRERQVLQQIARGYTNAQTAERLHLSPKTIETHRRNIMKKLNASSRAELVAFAMQTGLM